MVKKRSEGILKKNKKKKKKKERKKEEENRGIKNGSLLRIL